MYLRSFNVLFCQNSVKLDSGLLSRPKTITSNVVGWFQSVKINRTSIIRHLIFSKFVIIRQKIFESGVFTPEIVINSPVWQLWKKYIEFVRIGRFAFPKFVKIGIFFVSPTTVFVFGVFWRMNVKIGLKLALNRCHDLTPSSTY